AFFKGLSRWLQLLNSSLGLVVHRLVSLFVLAKVVERIVNRVFKSTARLVSGLHALRNQLANFKTVHTLRESAVNLIRTHDGLRPTVPCRQVMLRGVRGSSGAELRPEPSRLS